MTVLPLWFGDLWHVLTFSLDPEADLHELHSNQRMHGFKQYLFLRMIGKQAAVPTCLFHLKSRRCRCGGFFHGRLQVISPPLWAERFE
jgi:hypothetical protein